MGNKIDLEDDRKVSSEEAMALAAQHKMQYFETSAKLNKNIDELMQHLMEQVYKRMFNNNDEKREETVTINKRGHSQVAKEKKKGGCC